MVAHLLKLKLALLRNGFKRSPWQLVGVIIGGIYGLGLAVLLCVGMFALGDQPAELITTVVVLAVSLITLGWAIIPVLLSGVDLTLDPSRFSVYPIPPRQLVIGLLLSGFIGVPGLVMLLLFAGQGLAWRANAGLALVGILCGILAALNALAVSRLAVTAATALTSNRRFRELGMILLFVPLLMLGPILQTATEGLEAGLGWLPDISAVLAWTPLGAFAAVPGDVAIGAWGLAAARLVLSLAYLVAIIWAWKTVLVRALETPPQQSGGSRAVSGLGVAFRLFPATPWGAVASRCLTYWMKDPRYAMSIIFVPLVPILIWFWSSQGGNYTAMLYLAPIIAVLLAFSISADISYDNTAFSLHVLTGLRGFDDRLGRVAASAVFAVPTVLLAAILPAAFLGETELLPAILGLSLGALGTGWAVSSIASARYTYAVPLPGDNPMKTPPGTGARMAVTQLATFGSTIVLMLPEIILHIVFLVTGQELYAWLVLIAGVVLGALMLVAGLRIGGRWFDSRTPELMQATVLNC
ncbi:transporter [Arthrobacter rhombi]|uniref:transporter n=1 Tax=Arthrobacter rhombi TaxID=71253 RepID=UPI003FCFC04B